MIDCPSYWKPEMSEIEQRIKQHNLANHLVEDRIFSAEELSAYFIEALRAQNGKPSMLNDYYRGEIPDKVAELISFASDPQTDTETLAPLYAFRMESVYISDNFDVSVERMFRYIPVHWHSNEYFTICYCVNGNCSVSFEHETIPLYPGNVLVIAPNTIHAAPCYGDDKILVMYYLRATTFKRVFLDNLSDVPLISTFISKALNGETGTPYLLYPLNRNEQIDRLLYSAYEESLMLRDFSHSMINGLINVFFVLLFRNYNHIVRFSSSLKTAWKPEYLPIFHHIQSHYICLDMASLQQKFHYSDRQLNRIIKSCTGKTFSSLILELRMEKAKTLLFHKNSTITGVAEAVGYQDVNAFYRAFHSYTGLTPRHWKLQNRV